MNRVSILLLVIFSWEQTIGVNLTLGFEGQSLALPSSMAQKSFEKQRVISRRTFLKVSLFSKVMYEIFQQGLNAQESLDGIWSFFLEAMNRKISFKTGEDYTQGEVGAVLRALLGYQERLKRSSSIP